MKNMWVALVFVMGCSSCTRLTWAVGRVPTNCTLEGYSVTLLARTPVEVSRHMSNGRSVVIVQRGPYAGDVLICPTDRVMPR